MVRRGLYYLVVLLAVVGALLLFLVFYDSGKNMVTVEIDGVKVYAEVADDLSKKTKGLMFRESMGKNEGMLFPFDREDYYHFWMMNVRFPLDLIWINGDKTIIDITEYAQPCTSDCPSFTSKERAQYVLEVNAGFVRENNIRPGLKVNFRLR